MVPTRGQKSRQTHRRRHRVPVQPGPGEQFVITRGYYARLERDLELRKVSQYVSQAWKSLHRVAPGMSQLVMVTQREITDFITVGLLDRPNLAGGVAQGQLEVYRKRNTVYKGFPCFFTEGQPLFATDIHLAV